MNLHPKLKKNSQPAAEASCAASAGIDLLGDLEPLANLVQPIRIRAAEHTKLLDALGKARFELRHQKNAPPPEMILAIKREIVAATGDTESLARFDADNAAALKTEIESREQFLRNKELLPARIAALESLVQESALKTTNDLPVTEIEEEAQKLFAPYAHQRHMAVALGRRRHSLNPNHAPRRPPADEAVQQAAAPDDSTGPSSP